jgi:hypothetical protein
MPNASACGSTTFADDRAPSGPRYARRVGLVDWLLGVRGFIAQWDFYDDADRAKKLIVRSSRRSRCRCRLEGDPREGGDVDLRGTIADYPLRVNVSRSKST